jgi:hypothetical protein
MEELLTSTWSRLKALGGTLMVSRITANCNMRRLEKGRERESEGFEHIQRAHS